jgi:hypothetical protein
MVSLILERIAFAPIWFCSCSAYGIGITEVKAPVGGRADLKVSLASLSEQQFAQVCVLLQELESALRETKFNIVTLTHVRRCVVIAINDLDPLSRLIVLMPGGHVHERQERHQRPGCAHSQHPAGHAHRGM